MPLNRITKYWVLLLGVALTACQPSDTNQQAQGYIEGQYRYIAANFPGILKGLYVQRGTHVIKGQPLFSLELEPQSAELNQANAELKQAEAQERRDTAQVALTQLTLTRRAKLLQRQAIQQESVDEARTDYDQANAQLAHTKALIDAAKAKLAQASWSKAQKMVMSQEDALVFNTYYLPGELVPANRPVLTLLAPQDIKAIFFVPETQLAGLALGQTVAISCDSCPEGLSGKIAFISPQAEYTPPVIYSNETRKKLVYRVEARLSSSLAVRLHPGQPVTVSME